MCARVVDRVKNSSIINNSDPTISGKYLLSLSWTKLVGTTHRDNTRHRFTGYHRSVVSPNTMNKPSNTKNVSFFA